MPDSSKPRNVDDRTVVTIGVYDGVHIGHRALISHVRELAHQKGMRSAVVTFDPHPAAVVRPDLVPPLLTDIDHRLELLASTGIDLALVINFDRARSEESAEDFVTEVLVGQLGAGAVIVGADFHFGHGRRGDVDLLRKMGSEYDFDVFGIDLLGVDGSPADETRPVSSTLIREELRSGDIGHASEMLGRPYELRGIVGHGDGRAHDLGFPTANVGVADGMCLPRDGIYAGWYLTPDGERHSTAISLGRRPTFYEDATASVLEAHLLDFSGDLYGQKARVQFIARLRDEKKFDSVDALITQMGRDCEEARRILAHETIRDRESSMLVNGRGVVEPHG